MYTRYVRDVMDRRKLAKAPPGTTVRKAAKLMAAKHCGALLVVEDGKLVGIFTERDALFRVTALGLDPASTPIADVMTPSPLTIAPKTSFGQALYTMWQRGFRHLPVVEDGVAVGIVSARSAMDPDLEEYSVETARRKQFERAT